MADLTIRPKFGQEATRVFYCAIMFPYRGGVQNTFGEDEVNQAMALT
jgi:hypothetical protein